MDNSVDTPFSISSGFVLDPLLKSSPTEFPTDPIFRAFTGQSYSFSTAPIDTSYVYGYELITPDAANYVVPESFKINSQTGLINWDTKFRGTYLAGEYFFAIKVNQYDKAKRYLGYVVRSFSLLLEDSKLRMSISNPITDPIGKIIIVAPNQIKVKLLLSDSTDADSLRWFPYYHQSLVNNISFIQYDSAEANSKIRVGIFSFTSTDAITRELPYTIVLRGISSFKYAAKDVSYLLFTKNVELPVITEIGGEDGDVLIFPNPCYNELHVVGIPKSGKVQVFNNLGQPIMTSFIDSENKIDTTQLSPGVYFILVSDENSNARFKVIKK